MIAKSLTLALCFTLVLGCSGADFTIASDPNGIGLETSADAGDPDAQEGEADAQGADALPEALEDAGDAPDGAVSDSGAADTGALVVDSGHPTDTGAVDTGHPVDTGVVVVDTGVAVDTGPKDTGTPVPDAAPDAPKGTFSCGPAGWYCSTGSVCCLEYPGECMLPSCPAGATTVACQTSADCSGGKTCCVSGASKTCKDSC